MIFDKTCLWILPEYQRKSPGSLIINAKCEQCSRRCTISSTIPGGFPSAYVDKLGNVFSSLCAMQEEANPLVPEDGQLNHSSDASEA